MSEEITNPTQTTTPAALNYAGEYSSSLMGLWEGNLYYSRLYSTPNNSKLRWNGGKSVLLPVLNTTGRVNASRDTIETAQRNYENSWETKTLTHHRKWSTLIHPLDIDQTNYAANIGNITKTYNIEQKFPEMDAYMISKLYTDWVALGKTADTTALTSSSILTVFDNLMKAMDEKHIPFNGRILYLTPAAMNLLKSAQPLSHTVDVGRGKNSVSRIVSSLDGVEIVCVPADLMKSAYVFTEGWAVAEGATQLQMLLIHPGAIVAPISYQFSRLDPPSAVTEGKYIYFEESAEDVFIINGKKDAIAFSAGTVS